MSIGAATVIDMPLLSGEALLLDDKLPKSFGIVIVLAHPPHDDVQNLSTVRDMFGVMLCGSQAVQLLERVVWVNHG